MADKNSASNIQSSMRRQMPMDPNVLDGLRPNNGATKSNERDVAGMNTRNVRKSTSPAGMGPKQMGL